MSVHRLCHMSPLGGFNAARSSGERERQCLGGAKKLGQHSPFTADNPCTALCRSPSQDSASPGPPSLCCREIITAEFAPKLLREPPNQKYDNYVHGTVQVESLGGGWGLAHYSLTMGFAKQMPSKKPYQRR
jgi:hypothetical protein